MALDKKRFEVPLTAARHRELEALSRDIGVSTRDLARLAICQLLANREALIGTERQSAA